MEFQECFNVRSDLFKDSTSPPKTVDSGGIHLSTNGLIWKTFQNKPYKEKNTIAYILKIGERIMRSGALLKAASCCMDEIGRLAFF